LEFQLTSPTANKWKKNFIVKLQKLPAAASKPHSLLIFHDTRTPTGVPGPPPGCAARLIPDAERPKRQNSSTESGALLFEFL